MLRHCIGCSAAGLKSMLSAGRSASERRYAEHHRTGLFHGGDCSKGRLWVDFLVGTP